MANVRIHKQIAESVKTLSRTDRFIRKFGQHTINSFVTESVLFFLHKHKECFICPDHKDVVAGLELGRQSLAMSEGLPPKEFKFVQCDDQVLKRADEFRVRYNGTLREIVEQAILEHLTRPARCVGCPFFEEMKSVVGKK